MKRLLNLLLAMLLLLVPARAESVDVEAMQRARDALNRQGFSISDECFARALEYRRTMQEMYAWSGFDAGNPEQSELIYELLLCEGIGVYDYDALTWTPTSEQIYVFDAEFFNVEGMYTEFLQGVQSIMPDAQITDVREDLSGMNEYLEGKRKVLFEFNGHSYVVTLTSEGDWLNTEIIDFLNQVLKTEGDTNRLHIVSEGWDQLVFLIYGTEADAKALRRLLDVEEPASSVGESLLDWLGSLFGQ